MSSLAAGVAAARRRRAGAAAAGHHPERQGAPAGTPRRHRRCSPTASCGGCGARARVEPEGTGAGLSHRRRRWSVACMLVAFAARADRGGAPAAGARPRRARARRRCWRSARFARRRGGVGHRQRLRADGRRPRPDVRGLRRGAARARAAARRAARAASTDLVAMSAAAGGVGIWSEPAHWCGALAFALVVLAETGRQPVDNPDTHLELTMIHEGPLLEYAGRDLAYLQWAAAARHWLMLMLAAALFLPHPRGFAGAPGGARRGRARALRGPRDHRDGAGEDAHPARAARCSGFGSVVALVGIGAWLAGGGGMSSALVAAMLAARPGGDRRAPALGRDRAHRRAVARCSASARCGLASGRSATTSSPASCCITKAVRAARAAARRRAPHARAAARGRRRRRARAAGRRRRGRARRRRARARRSGSATPQTEQTAVALVLVGIAIVVARRPASSSCSALIVAENGAVAAGGLGPGRAAVRRSSSARCSTSPSSSPSRSAFTRRIHRELGTGDTELLRGLRD